MTRKDRVFCVNENRVRKPEGLDTVGNLAQLFLRMGPGVTRPGFEIANGDRFYREGHGSPFP